MSNNKYVKIEQPFEPIYDENSRILILGTMASVKSREVNFYYGNPKNRFWQVLAQLTSSVLPNTIFEKKNLILRNNIAIWDVLKSCEIIGSSDSSIKNPVANDLSTLISATKISKIYTNGKTAERLYSKLCAIDINIKSICLPSTSPANATYSLKKLVEEWAVIF